ncbi:MAG: hypothetical protein MJZ16_02130 [Bacteroidales bacterium]|nr:hypothetical protein [Bacteroidales bacterium]
MRTRFLLFALSVLSLFAVSSCTKEYVYENTYVEELHPTVVKITVEQNNWNYSSIDNNNYFYATVQMPELTKEVLEKGLFKVYRVFDENKQMEMPYVRLNEYFAGTDDFGNDIWGFYTETVDTEFEVGKLTIYYTASDFDYEIDDQFVPVPMKFRFVMYK